ncbi:MAG: S8 family serine peptidase [Rhizobacter sp.]|nr:S8 family serine peptidase [Rhizobacter sp.]
MSIARTWKTALALSAALVLAACGGGGGSGPSESDADQAPLADPSARSVQSLNLPGGAVSGVIDPSLARASGTVDVWVTLSDAPVAAAAATLSRSALATGDREQAQSVRALRSAPEAMRSALRSHRASMMAHQDTAASSIRSLGGTELGRVQMAHNAIAVRVDASRLAAIAALPGVTQVRRVVDHQMSLSETVPYIGASAVQAAGFDGTGVRVAVIDSGIDYTHKNLGGAGTAEAYEKAYGTDPSDPRNTTIDPSVFPTAKVVGGYDFVGDAWPTNGPRSEDPNPIDFQGHGTHVADIIGGRSLDGTHKGVAPGAQLIAVKVCSSVATSCNGVAILKGIDYALDPNGDGDPSDAVDVINLSLGSSYGQVQDDSTLAVSTAVDLGVVVAVAAGNDANKPYIVSSPSIAPGAISVAQTAVPSEVAYGLRVNQPAAIAGVYGNTATVDWAPIGAGFTGDVVAVGTACPDDPALPASVAGKVVLIDRGVCSISLKVDKAGAAGAIGVLLGLVAPGDAVSFSYGGGTHLVPTLVIQQSLSQAIKANIAAPVNVTVSDATRVDMVGSMASTSARGPSISFQTIKPEIGAPGASVSAVVGSGDGQEAFGGTSGATPMIAGSAALLIQAFPNRTPLQIKSMLMNSASTAVYTNAALLPGRLAPISRIGAGEVRVNKALALNTVAYNKDDLSAALSFGAREVSSFAEYEKKLVVENLSNQAKTFRISNSFRYADDEASGAVSISAPHSVRVAANGRATVTVKLRVNPLKLPAWGLDGGALGGRGDLLDGNEYDGYLTLTAGAETLSVPWHILPRKAADAGALLAQRSNWPGGVILFGNAGLAESEFDVFALTGTSTKVPASELPQPGDNVAVIDMRAVGVRYLEAEGALQFAINTFGRRAHPVYPGGYEVDIDVNSDGVPDFAVYNQEQGGFAATGISLVYVANLATGTASAYYYMDADLNSANAIMTIPFAALGVPADTQLTFSAYAYDNYFTGNTSDAILDMGFTPSKPRYAVAGDSSGVVRPLRLARVDTLSVAGGAQASPSQTGFLVMMRRNAGKEAEVLTVR